jgi:hypothetical protein
MCGRVESGSPIQLGGDPVAQSLPLAQMGDCAADSGRLMLQPSLRSRICRASAGGHRRWAHVTIIERLVYGHRWWHRRPRVVLRGVRAGVALGGLSIGAVAGTKWE